ncbi:MAG: helix-turn-helix transcriptional regulator [Anaerolineae bacterium]|nr:helix-turn-helix transcriptional regulator [Anaerolineae bacterium]
MIQDPTIGKFGDLLKRWRKIRRFSQLELALAANVSTRHLSFVETGRAHPGDDLILRLAEVLQLSLQHTNAMLMAAGYAPRFSAWSLEDDHTGLVRAALVRILAQHEPHPAFVTTRNYDLIMANNGAHQLIDWLTDGDDLLTRFGNSYRMLFATDGLRPYLRDFDRLQTMLLKRLYEESIHYQSPALLQLYETCMADVRDLQSVTPVEFDPPLPVMTLVLQKHHLELAFFSTVTTFGTAIDVTTQELRIESLFPANAETDQLLQALGTENRLK